MADRYVIEFDSRQATLKGMDGRFVRRFSARGCANIVQATVSGEGDDAMVTLNYDNGRADACYWHGAIYRSL